MNIFEPALQAAHRLPNHDDAHVLDLIEQAMSGSVEIWRLQRAYNTLEDRAAASGCGVDYHVARAVQLLVGAAITVCLDRAFSAAISPDDLAGPSPDGERDAFTFRVIHAGWQADRGSVLSGPPARLADCMRHALIAAVLAAHDGTWQCPAATAAKIAEVAAQRDDLARIGYRIDPAFGAEWSTLVPL